MAYTPEQIAAHKATICERIANGESLKAICEDDALPSKALVFAWLGQDADFLDKYARAREAQADAVFDEILTIADDGRNDWMERKNAEGQNIGWMENGEALRRSQLRIDARKWMAGKLKPKKYGDRLDLNHSGHIDNMPEDQVNDRIADLLRKAGVEFPAIEAGKADPAKPA